MAHSEVLSALLVEKKRIEKLYNAVSQAAEIETLFGESEKNGPIVEQVTTTILRPTAFSPMK